MITLKREREKKKLKISQMVWKLHLELKHLHLNKWLELKECLHVL